jgi:hypothetical protein
MIRQSNCASILLNAIPKSASTFLFELLARGLHAKRIKLTIGIFPDDLILFPRIQTFAEGGQIARHHFPATTANLAYLRRFKIRPIIHIRDPRAVLVSWTYHLAEVAGGWDELFWYYPAICPPPVFLKKSFGWQLNWCFEHHFPVFLDWIAGWCRVADQGSVRILFSSYEDFVRDGDAAIEKMLQFCGLLSRFQHPHITPSRKLLLREGTVDGWRAVARSIKERSNRAIPGDFWRRFGWLP